MKEKLPPVPPVTFTHNGLIEMCANPLTHYDLGTYAPVTKVRKEPKVGRNEPCSCGSGKKNKNCCNTK